ncbi:CshA/CshB family fibrillar adhesin-related protein [Deinococcus taklimakanensis]|uniref:CshA/CshB family fibrillar adhesin-related protein n=1 Tax=Deinococcus taklimakanensis TaxID=536443 RepID=A0ABW5P6A9_9DEIO
MLGNHAGAQTATDTTCNAATSKGTSGDQANWQSVCWIDFSKLSGPAVTGFDPTPSPSLLTAGQNFRVKLTDGSTLSFNVKPAATNATTWVAATAPSWEGAAIGSAASYTGIPGRPILRYQRESAPTNGLVFSNIAMTDPKGNPVTNFRFLAADGESTDASSSTLKESWKVTTNGAAWTVFDKVANTAGLNPNATSATFTTSTSVIGPHVAGTDTTTITETGVSSNNAGSYIYSTVAPTTVNFSAAAPEPGMQGIMIGVQVAVLNLQKDVKSRVFPSDQFTYSIQNSASGAVTSNTTSGSTPGMAPMVSTTQVGAPVAHTFSEIGANSNTVLNNYNSTYSCSNVISSTTALPSGTGTSFSLTPAPGDVITCTLTNTARPQLPVTKSYSPATIPSDGVTTSTLTIMLGNSTGTAHTLSAALNDNIGAGLVITGVSGGTCDATRTSYSGTTITYAAGATIPSGGCTIRATVRSTTPGSYPNTIPAGALTTTQGGINPTAANATLTVTTPTPPKLTITKSDNNQAFMAGQTGTYTVTVSNASGAAATSGAIAVSDLLPSGMSFNSVTTTTAGSFGTRPAASATNRVDWTFTPAAPLTAGQSIAFTVTVNVANIAADGTTLTNFASVGGGGDPDPQPTPGATCTGEQCASDTTTILAPSGPAVPPGTWSSSTCLDFSGVALSVGGTPITRTVTTAEGVVITYTLDVTSNAQYATGATPTNASTENVLKGYVPGGWSGDRWDDYFGSNKTNAVSNNPVGRKVGFTLSAYATYNNQTVPLTVLTGSAEDDSTNEYVKTTTNGTPFAVADRTTGNSRYGDVTVSGNGQTVQMSVNSATGNFLLVATSKADATSSNPLVLTSEMAGHGATAQGYCVAFPFDRGDAPTSYGNAAHLQSLTFASPLTSNTTGTNNLNSATFAPSATTSRTTSVLNGQPDSEKVEKGATATEDSDDVLTTPLKALRLSDKAYAVTLPYATNVAATISGWIDFNGNGTFDTAERVTASVPAGVGQATLNWSGITVTTASTGTFARFRIATNPTEATAPTGAAIVGEVEDYPLPVDRSARLTFVVNAIPDHAQDFVYTATGTGLSNFTLDDDADPTLGNTRSFAGLSSGTYTVTQAAVAGWKLTGLSCTPSGSATMDSASGKVTVALTDGADVTCTYTNTQLPNVSLTKYVRNTAVQDQKFSATSSQALPGQILQYCIAFNNTGATAGNFVLVDAFPRNTTAQGNLIYSAPATDLTQSSASPTATPLPAGATYSATNVPEKPGSQTLVPGVKLDLGAAGLVGGTSGTVCFNATVQ